MFLLCIRLSVALAAISMPLYRRAIEKGIEKHTISSLTSPRELSTSISATNYKNVEYFIEATIGTRPQEFTLWIDTVSTWTWIDANNCNSCHANNTFNPRASSTYDNTTEFKHFYTPGGESSGYVSSDVISIGNLNATHQPFILVTSEDGLASMQSDGLLGLGFEASSNGSSIITNLESLGQIKNRQFSLHLSENRDESDLSHKGSILIIDGYDLDKYSSEDSFTYVNLVTSTKYWRVPCNGVIFNNEGYTSGTSAIIYASSSNIIGPKDDVIDILLTLVNSYSCSQDGLGYVSCDCDESYPKITFVLSNKEFTLLPIDYFHFEEDNCYPTLQYRSDIDYWVLGEKFIRRFYLHFDMDNKRIGFAKSKERSSSEGWPTWKLAVVIAFSVVGLIVICALSCVLVAKSL